MRNLLSANFARLWKSRFFWVLEAVAALWGVFVFALAAVNTHDFGVDWAMSRANSNFFIPLLYIGPALAIFSGFYIGLEYSDGTIRNKLCAGHRRWEVYLANLTVCAAVGLVLLTTHFLFACAVGLPFTGTVTFTGLYRPVWGIICCLCVMLAYGALFTLITMLDANKARASVVVLLLSFALLLAGMVVFSHLQSLELIRRTILADPGAFSDVDARLRRLEHWKLLLQGLEVFLPSSQSMYLVNPQRSAPAYMPLCSLGLAAGLTGLGLFLFRRKDLK